MIKKIALSALLASSSSALISIKPVEVGSEGGWSLKTALSLSTKRGNSEVDNYSAAARITYDNNVSYVTWMQASGAYGKASGRKNVANAYMHWRYIHNVVDGNNAFEGALQTEEDEFRLIRSRRLGALGYRRRFHNGGAFKAFVGIGGIYEYIDFSSSLDPTEHNVRLNVYLSLNYRLNEDRSIHFISYNQPKMDDIHDLVSSSSFELKIRIVHALFLNFSLNYNYDSHPAHEVAKRYDFSQDTAFVYKF